MRRFRHQHEQLRTVIVRVLRPNMGPTGANRNAENEQTIVSNEQQQETAFDSADSSAIEVIIETYFHCTQ